MSPNNGSHPNYPLLEFSAKVEYALLALMELASCQDPTEPLTVNEIVARQPIPERYLEHIFTLLRRGGIVQSQRGSRGGYVLACQPWQITVSEVIAMVEGSTRSAPRGRKDNETAAVTSIERDLVRDLWQQVIEASQTTLNRYTIEDLCQTRNAKKQKTPMYYI
ncbi:Rrf2 family transcriptional regulator (plasmid) [Kovacikia minuta CCNUW1]|uniref:RrF2 family transcriptional regulator n=1 Tax=Kovacikia minuta TaxID=2931930 RepID=UPI001CCEF142|nr:Rrf2 family transcriptional regulator [Kovacikia minuta]UBF30598.1 Rrf2 family transcriptional regulator [Kovacikia minuta CCNUW1]